MYDLAVILIVVFTFCIFLRFLDSVEGATTCGPLYCGIITPEIVRFCVYVMLLKTSIENTHFCLSRSTGKTRDQKH